MSNYCISQDGYPKRMLSNKDTINCFTDKQVSIINQVYLRMNENYDMYINCERLSLKKDTIIDMQEQAILSLKKEREISSGVIKEGASVISKTKKQLKREKIKSSLMKGFLGSTVITLVTLSITAGIMLVKK